MLIIRILALGCAWSVETRFLGDSGRGRWRLRGAQFQRIVFFETSSTPCVAENFSACSGCEFSGEAVEHVAKAVAILLAPADAGENRFLP